MDLTPGWKIVGAVLLIATAVGFTIENVWVFLAAVILLIVWLGGVLNGAHEANKS